jgi:hypothetical protein
MIATIPPDVEWRIERARELRAEGLTYRAVAAQLQRETGLPHYEHNVRNWVRLGTVPGRCGCTLVEAPPPEVLAAELAEIRRAHVPPQFFPPREPEAYDVCHLARASRTYRRLCRVLARGRRA